MGPKVSEFGCDHDPVVVGLEPDVSFAPSDGLVGGSWRKTIFC